MTEKKYKIEYRGVQLSTDLWTPLSDEEFIKAKEEYFARPDIEEARKCFFDQVHHHDPATEDETIQFGFEDCLTGAGLTYDGKNEWGTLFVRQEEISDKFDPKQMPWA